MQLSYGMTVFSADGENLGKLKELIVDPRHRMVTHLVVQHGLFFAHDRLVSVEHIKESKEGTITLSITARTLEEATDAFEREQYVDLDDLEFVNRFGVGGAVWCRPAGEFSGAGLNTIVPPGIGPIPPEPEVSISGDEVGLEHGAIIMSSDGVRLGTLEECLMDDNDRITHLVMAEGHFFKESKKIPVDWVQKIEENEVFLGVPLAVVEKI